MKKKINVSAYRRRAYRKKKILSAFMRKLEKQRPRAAAAAMREGEKEAWKTVDCTSCGNCCMTMTPTWKKSEIRKVAAHLGMTYQDFYDKWLYTEEETGDIMNATTPCQFFDKRRGLCKIYHLRPHDCATFPHLYRRDFFDQMEVYEQNLHRCPATLVAMEHLYKAMQQQK